MRRTLVVGADRPLGASFTRLCLARGDRVYASARHPEKTPVLEDLAAEFPGQLTSVAMQPADEDSVERARALIGGSEAALDVLVNAGWADAASEELTAGERVGALRSVVPGDLLGLFLVNAVAPLLVARRFRLLLRAGVAPRILNVGSWQGSIAGRTDGGHYGAGMTGAALFMATRLLAFDLEPDGILVLGGNPGLIKIHLHGPGGQLTADHAAAGLLRALDSAESDRSGRVVNWLNEVSDW